MASNRPWALAVLMLVLGITIGIALALAFQLSSFPSLEESNELLATAGRSLSRRKANDNLIFSTIKAPNETNSTHESLYTGPWSNDADAKRLRLGLVKPEIISWSPRIIVLHNFLSEEECNGMVGIGRPQLELSTVVDVATGKGIRSSARTSSGMFLSQNDRKQGFVKDIEYRIAAYSMVPFENGEQMQILRYELEQEYRPHHDFFADEFNIRRGGQRVATMLMYIMEPEEGGQTIFPNVAGKDCICGKEKKQGLCVPSKKGTAVLFWDMKLNGQTDSDSLHGSCPVLKGEKWSATKWMRQGVFT